MNQKNAEAKGQYQGEAYQRQQRNLNNPLSEENYKRHGAHVAQIDARSPKTQQLFIKGWNAAWEEPNPVEHNPNSRFCSCPECMKGD